MKSLAKIVASAMLLLGANTSAQANAELLASLCSGCHNNSRHPRELVYNAAGNTAIIAAVNSLGMGAGGSGADHASIAAYLDTIKPAITMAPVAHNSPGTVISLRDIRVSAAVANAHLKIIGGIETVSPPRKGTVTYNYALGFNTPSNVVYTPFPGQSGEDTWTYKGIAIDGKTALDTTVRTASVNISGPGSTKSLGSRATVSPGATLYGGFELANSALVYVLVRGNSLGTLGVTQGFLDAPRVRIYNGQGQDVVFESGGQAGFNGCTVSANSAAPVVNYYQNVRGQPAHIRDACIAQTLAPGAYSFSVTPSILGVTTGSETSVPNAGEVLFEVTLGGGVGSIAKTLGSRASVTHGATLYGGFEIASSSVVYILVRGNSLGTLGITQSYLDAPRVRIFDGQGRDLITNVNGNAGFNSCLAADSLQQPVFDYYRLVRAQPAESRDACIRQVLNPGVYSFSVTPSSVSVPASGEVLFEVTLSP